MTKTKRIVLRAFAVVCAVVVGWQGGLAALRAVRGQEPTRGVAGIHREKPPVPDVFNRQNHSGMTFAHYAAARSGVLNAIGTLHIGVARPVSADPPRSTTYDVLVEIRPRGVDEPVISEKVGEAVVVEGEGDWSKDFPITYQRLQPGDYIVQFTVVHATRKQKNLDGTIVPIELAAVGDVVTVH